MSTNALAMIVSLNTIFYYCINWCSGERSYEPSMFHNRVERIPIDDHNVPRLRLESDLSPVVTLSLSLVACDVWWKGRKRGRDLSLAVLLSITRHAPLGRERERETTGDKKVFLSSPSSSPLLLPCMLCEKTRIRILLLLQLCCMHFFIKL